MLIDTHCHLDFPAFDADRDQVIARAKANGIGYIVNIGSSLKGSRDCVALAAKYECVYAAVGIHPHEADLAGTECVADLKKLSGRDKVVAIGEIGLDYYRNLSDHQSQKRLFSDLIGLAKETNLPIIVHTRAAQDDTLKILNQAMPIKAVLHCFSSGEDFLQACLEMGFYVSFTCNITYKKANDLRELIKIIPLERLLLETDAPFLPPEGLRGRRNEPAQVKLLAEEISRIKGIGFDALASITTNNAKSFFKLT
jgi:TatD DNase family protein